MIQGGDPTGTGKGGQSIWGRPFNDEIRQTLKVRLIRGIGKELITVQWKGNCSYG